MGLREVRLNTRYFVHEFGGKLFQKHGAVVNEEFLWAMQEKDSQYITENQKNCRQEGDESDGGLFEVCSVSNTWLVGKREQRNVRMHRSVTTENGELEPWFFAFRKKSFHGKNRTH